MTKHKYYVTAVKIKDPYKYHLIEVFWKQGDKLLRNIGGLQSLCRQLEFANGKTLIIKDFDKLVIPDTLFNQ